MHKTEQKHCAYGLISALAKAEQAKVVAKKQISMRYAVTLFVVHLIDHASQALYRLIQVPARASPEDLSRVRRQIT